MCDLCSGLDSNAPTFQGLGFFDPTLAVEKAIATAKLHRLQEAAIAKAAKAGSKGEVCDGDDEDGT